MANSSSRECLSLWEQRAALVQGKGLRLLRRSDEALRLLQRAVDVGVDLYDTDRSAALADAQIALAECLIDLGRFDEAAPLAQRAKAIHATHAQLGEHYTQPLLALQTRLAMTPAMDERTAS
jgi:tetratricopeptide (TPR) repeat protein